MRIIIDTMTCDKRNSQVELLSCVVVVNPHKYLSTLREQAIEWKHKWRMLNPHPDVTVVSTEHKNVKVSAGKFGGDAINGWCLDPCVSLAYYCDSVASGVKCNVRPNSFPYDLFCAAVRPPTFCLHEISRWAAWAAH